MRPQRIRNSPGTAQAAAKRGSRTAPCVNTTPDRTDDMLIIRGVNVFPSQIEEALLQLDGTAPHYLIEVDRPGVLDQISVKVEVRPEDFSDKMSQVQALHDAIDRKIQSITGIRAIVELVAPRTLERSAGKARRVIDHRTKKRL